MSDTTTRGVRVEVKSAFVPERSAPRENHYFFAYRVRISNVGEETVHLVSREWIITDAEGNVEQVNGPGVVGEQPILEPGEHFEYTSFCPLPTPIGSMHGSYQMLTDTGEKFDANIPEFQLTVPNTLH